jgi:hypothetical protein
VALRPGDIKSVLTLAMRTRVGAMRRHLTQYLTQYLKPNHVERAGELNTTSLYWLRQVTGGPEICKEGEILQQPEEVAEGDFYSKLKYFEFVSVTAGNGRRRIKSLAMGCQT